jgi:hypothetical protein
MSEAMPKSYISIYDRAGIKLTEIIAPSARAWMINDYGTNEFVIPGNHSQFNRRNLALRNPIVVRTPGLPAWGGYLWTDRVWNPDESVVAPAKSAELALGLRRSEGFSGSIGTICAAMIEAANAKEDTLLRVGVIEDSIFNYTDIGRPPSKLFDALKSMISSSGMEYEIVPVEANGKLAFVFNLRKRISQSITNFALQEGYNMALPRGGPPLTEQGQIANDIVIYRNNSAGGYVATHFVSDAASQSEFGLCEDSISVEADSQLSDQAIADTAIALRKQPTKTFALEVFDRTEHGTNTTFDYLRLGNEISIKFSRIGFNASGGRGITTTARITGIAYSDETNTCHVTVEEIAA